MNILTRGPPKYILLTGQDVEAKGNAHTLLRYQDPLSAYGDHHGYPCWTHSQYKFCRHPQAYK